MCVFFFFKKKTAYEMRISDWSSDVCSSDLALLWADATSAADRQLAYTSPGRRAVFEARLALKRKSPDAALKMQAAEATGASDAGFIADKAMWMRATGNSWGARDLLARRAVLAFRPSDPEEWYEALLRSEEHTSELQSLMRT